MRFYYSVLFFPILDFFYLLGATQSPFIQRRPDKTAAQSGNRTREQETRTKKNEGKVQVTFSFPNFFFTKQLQLVYTIERGPNKVNT